MTRNRQVIRPKGLGRGLDALLAGSDAGAENKDSLQMLPIDRLRPGKYQPRTRMDEASLAELADSIREQGVMQPVLVRPVENGRFEIIDWSRAGPDTEPAPADEAADDMQQAAA